MSNIIFLDIDGPMIPNTSFLFDINCSFDQILDQRCVDVLKKICQDGDAHIVLNTTHNLYLQEWEHSPGLLNQFDKYGLTEFLHPEHPVTPFPNVGTSWF